jgi:hypothetical protein
MMDTIELLKEPVLCYIENSKAYFTTCPIEHQWGDDWNDAPYEHNAGTPYLWHEHDLKRGLPEYRIETVYFEVDMDTPCSNVINSPFSVEAINRGDIAWLRPSAYSASAKKSIHAGVTLNEFKQIIRENGGDVWVLDTPPR